jgi:hypothetical protein
VVLTDEIFYQFEFVQAFVDGIEERASRAVIAQHCHCFVLSWFEVAITGFDIAVV